MTVRLENTTAAEVDAEVARERHRRGGGASGLVLTLVIACDEETADDAMVAASTASRQHPCRILCVIPRPGRGKPQLDAEVSVGEQEGPGENVVLRLRGQLAGRGASVVVPLLASDTPVVVWWPGRPPDHPASDPLGALAQRRITDAAASARPRAELHRLAAGYSPGDTDLAWARCTPWRSLLAAALDQPGHEVESVAVHAAAANPSAPLLAGWLGTRLGAPTELHPSRGPGVTAVRLNTPAGELALTRSDGRSATYTVPGWPRREVALPRRTTADLLAEELRRLNEDPVFGESLAAGVELLG